jgi:hypothetical protein
MLENQGEITSSTTEEEVLDKIEDLEKKLILESYQKIPEIAQSLLSMAKNFLTTNSDKKASTSSQQATKTIGRPSK